MKPIIRCSFVVFLLFAMFATPAGARSHWPHLPRLGPTAAFTYSPVAPQAGQPVTFSGASSTCPDSPCTYQWSDDGGPIQP